MKQLSYLCAKVCLPSDEGHDHPHAEIKMNVYLDEARICLSSNLPPRFQKNHFLHFFFSHKRDTWETEDRPEMENHSFHTSLLNLQFKCRRSQKTSRKKHLRWWWGKGFGELLNVWRCCCILSREAGITVINRTGRREMRGEIRNWRSSCERQSKTNQLLIDTPCLAFIGYNPHASTTLLSSSLSEKQVKKPWK